ncbi:MAG: hypothetical protein RIR48_793 [Bacteroidota bacterium]
MIVEVLSPNWYMEPPIDFEYKQYILLAYLQKVDKSFMDKKLSPYLLNLENIVNELYVFKTKFEITNADIQKNKYFFFEDNKKTDDSENILLVDIVEIVDFSIPQINTRIDLGKTILNRYKQLLY